MHIAHRVVIWTDLVEVELDMDLPGFIRHFQFRRQAHHNVNVTKGDPSERQHPFRVGGKDLEG